MLFSNEVNWPKLEQGRFHHSVGAAIAILIASPRRVENLNLKNWSIGSNRFGRRCVFGPDILNSFYEFDYLERISDDIPPVILAEMNGRLFVLDGGHRLAKWLLLQRPTIPMVRLNSTESQSCIRPGMEATVARLSLDQFEGR